MLPVSLDIIPRPILHCSPLQFLFRELRRFLSSIFDPCIQPTRAILGLGMPSNLESATLASTWDTTMTTSKRQRLSPRITGRQETASRQAAFLEFGVTGSSTAMSSPFYRRGICQRFDRSFGIREVQDLVSG
jgi:hypothetical protein